MNNATRRVLILGGSSDIGIEVVKNFLQLILGHFLGLKRPIFEHFCLIYKGQNRPF